MRLAPLLAAAALVLATPGIARADDIEQTNQVTFGVMGSYVPAQNDLEENVAAIGHYVAFTHTFDFVYVGARAAILYGWLPSGASGQQFLLEPDFLVGLQLKPRDWRVALRLEVGSGPLVNAGEGFATTEIDHSYVRAEAQVTIVKSVLVEAFAGPSFIVGPYTVGTLAELGLGCGWNF